jgi:hypothetical protein
MVRKESCPGQGDSEMLEVTKRPTRRSAVYAALRVPHVDGSVTMRCLKASQMILKHSNMNACHPNARHPNGGPSRLWSQ